MFNTDNVKISGESKYQSSGISEKVKVKSVELNISEQYGTKTITLKTINEKEQTGNSRKLYLNTEKKEGSKVSAWEVTAEYLIKLLIATGKTEDEARKVLVAETVEQLKTNLENNLIGKEFRGLFTAREYQPGKFIVELFKAEPVGGTSLVFDKEKHVKNLPAQTTTSDGLPF